MTDVTLMLEAVANGDERAADRLLEAVYGELRKLAAARFRHEAPQTLQPTGLVHEAYLRLVGDASASWQNRAHFFAAAAEAMRRILVERARARGRLKRGGGRQRVDLHDADVAVGRDPVDLLALDEALDALAADYPERAELVKLRYFAGLEITEAARVLDVSRATADRHWAFARAWLYDRLRAGDTAG
jgi:RNA polymerase sigma factor (TIGR02999 family)